MQVLDFLRYFKLHVLSCICDLSPREEKGLRMADWAGYLLNQTALSEGKWGLWPLFFRQVASMIYCPNFMVNQITILTMLNENLPRQGNLSGCKETLTVSHLWQHI